jgi:hypothetical protein
MPWRVTSPMYLRQRFVLDAEHTLASFAELCRRYGWMSNSSVHTALQCFLGLAQGSRKTAGVCRPPKRLAHQIAMRRANLWAAGYR